MSVKFKKKFLAVKLAIVGLMGLAFFMGQFGFTSESEKVFASAQGPTPGVTNAPGETNCTSCHLGAANTGTGNITISGVPAKFRKNQTVPITVTVAQSDAVIYGFQLTAIDDMGRNVGTLTFPNQNPAQLQTVNGEIGGNSRTYIEHTIDGTAPTQFGSKSWTFNWTAPVSDVGRVRFFSAGNAANSDGGPGGDSIYTTSASAISETTPFDFDGDGKTDISIFRPAPAEWWYLKSSNGGNFAAQFGASTDKIATADFTGDGKTDIAFFRPSTGQWFVLRSEDSSFYAFPFGANGDVSVPADFDGDGKADAAVFRPSTTNWFVLRSSDGGVTALTFGASGDAPVVADYDGDRKADIAIYRANGANQEWWGIRSSNSTVFAAPFGTTGDKAVPGDYTGDGKADLAFYRPSTGNWFVLRSQDSSFYAFPFGASSDLPAPGDYDGDGKFDATVFRPATANWFTLRSTDSSVTTSTFGAPTDQPLPGAYVR